MDERDARLQELIDRQVAEGTHIGVRVCAYRNGEPFVDVVPL